MIHLLVHIFICAAVIKKVSLKKAGGEGERERERDEEDEKKDGALEKRIGK